MSKRDVLLAILDFSELKSHAYIAKIRSMLKFLLIHYTTMGSDDVFPFTWGDNKKYNENVFMPSKNSLVKSHRANFNDTWHRASLGVGD